MSEAGRALALAAEALIGTKFRLHGRNPASGLDCVGVVDCALRSIGREGTTFIDYGLRNGHRVPFLRVIAAAGFAPSLAAQGPGDLIAALPGPGQMHLLIVARHGGFIHAHASLGRVVWSPEPLAWPLLQRWRLIEN